MAWDLAHQPKGKLVTTRKPGHPWPVIGRHTPAPWAGSYMDLGGEGVYRLEGDTLTVALLGRGLPPEPGDDPFRPAAGKTIEVYRRVRREPDSSYRPAPFPKGPAKVIATWDEDWHGVLQNPPRGALDHYTAYDLGDGVRVIRRDGVENLNDPPAPDLDPADVPMGTIVHPAGGKFDDATYGVVAPVPDAKARAVIEAFRAQNPDVHDRRLTYPGLFDGPREGVFSTYSRFLGWGGILLTTRSDPDRIIAEVVFRPRVLGISCYGNRTLLNYSPVLVETWELRGGELHYLGGGPELGEEDGVAASLLPSDPRPVPNGPIALPVRPRPAHLPPVDPRPIYPTLIHFRPDRIDLEDATRNSTEAGPPDPANPEFTIHHAFQASIMMPPPAAREAFFAEVLETPGYRQSRWDGVIKSAVPEAEGIRAEILVWPLGSVLEAGRFRTAPVRPFLETWVYADHRLKFVSARPASGAGDAGP
jgi:hypothetical protein